MEREKILKILQTYTVGVCTTQIVKDILNGLKWEQGLKSAVNRALYAMEKEELVYKIDATPPLWRIRVSSPSNEVAAAKGENRQLTIVYIDVDNSPCLKEAVDYAKDNVFVVAFASPAYNHFVSLKFVIIPFY